MLSIKAVEARDTKYGRVHDIVVAGPEKQLQDLCEMYDKPLSKDFWGVDREQYAWDYDGALRLGFAASGPESRAAVEDAILILGGPKPNPLPDNQWFIVRFEGDTYAGKTLFETVESVMVDNVEDLQRAQWAIVEASDAGAARLKRPKRWRPLTETLRRTFVEDPFLPVRIPRNWEGGGFSGPRNNPSARDAQKKPWTGSKSSNTRQVFPPPLGEEIVPLSEEEIQANREALNRAFAKYGDRPRKKGTYRDVAEEEGLAAEAGLPRGSVWACSECGTSGTGRAPKRCTGCNALRENPFTSTGEVGELIIVNAENLKGEEVDFLIDLLTPGTFAAQRSPRTRNIIQIRSADLKSTFTNFVASAPEHWNAEYSLAGTLRSTPALLLNIQGERHGRAEEVRDRIIKTLNDNAAANGLAWACDNCGHQGTGKAPMRCPSCKE